MTVTLQDDDLEQPAEQSAEPPAEQPSEPPAEQPAESPAEQPAESPAELPPEVEKPAPAQETPPAAAAATATPPAAAPVTAPSAPPSGINEHELLTEQFSNYMNIAKALMKTLKRPKDIEICTNIMRKVEMLNDSKHLEVKRNNNRFFCYTLRVLHWTSTNQPLEYYQHWYNPCNRPPEEPLTESRTWLEDNKSFIALKSYKDGTSVIYAAIANDPAAGWQDGGLHILAKKSACQRD